MRLSKFGDVYCQNEAEARHYLDEHSDGDVYIPTIDPPEGDFGATAEVVQNGNGETVCWIEAPTVDALRATINALGIELQD